MAFIIHANRSMQHLHGHFLACTDRCQHFGLEAHASKSGFLRMKFVTWRGVDTHSEQIRSADLLANPISTSCH